MSSEDEARTPIIFAFPVALVANLLTPISLNLGISASVLAPVTQSAEEPATSPIKSIPLVVLASKRASNTGRKILVVTSNEKTDDVLNATPVKYRNDKVSGSKVTSLADRFFGKNGKSTVDDEDILKVIQGAGFTDSKDNVTWDGNSLKVNGVDVDTSTKARFVKSFSNAIGENTGGDKMGDDDYDNFLKDNGLK